MKKIIPVTCEKKDVPALMAFMRAKWSESHIMANSAEYIDYFFYNREKDKYNIIYALDNGSGEIEGFIAFTTASFYDASIEPEDDFIWLTNWLVTENAKSAGLTLYAAALSEAGCAGSGTVGQNAVAEPIYRRLGYETGALAQYYMFANAGNGGGRELAPLGGEALARIEKHNVQTPRKTAAFIVNKYLKSPYYKYYVYGGERGAVIFRLQEYPEGTEGYGKRCIRIVEYFGELSVISGWEREFQSLLEKFGAEYLDFYCHGINEEILFDAGFKKNGGEIVLPNYFEPFVNENIEIRYAYKTRKGAFTVFKGDGDRDFPRLY